MPAHDEVNKENALEESRLTITMKDHIPYDIPHDNIRRVTLKNGLTVLLAKQGTAPKVLVQIAYDVGSSIERDGERGLAHLLEHMIFKGTDTLKEGDIDAVARRYGASFNAFTSHHMTSYYFEADKENWHPFLPIFADCMQNARFNDQHLASELRAVVQELRMYKDSIGSVMFEHAFATLFPANHPYHSPIIGYKEDLADMSGDRLQEFYKKYYHPSRAVLCIVGDIDLDAAEREARDVFEKVEASGHDYEPEFPQQSRELQRSDAVFYRDIQVEKVGLYWPIEGLSAGRGHILDAAGFLLGQGTSSRLHKRLVDELQIAVSISAGAQQLREAGAFLINFTPRPGKRDECVAQITAELNNIAQNGVSDEEIYKMVKTEQRAFWQQLESLGHFTYEWLETYFLTKDECEVFNYANRYASVTSDDIKAFVSEYLDQHYMNRVVVSPIPEGKKDVWQQNQQKEEEYYNFLLKHHARTEPLEEPEYVHTLADPKPLSFEFPKPELVKDTKNGLRVIAKESDSSPLITCAYMLRDASYFARAKDSIAMSMMMAMLTEKSTKYHKADILKGFDMHGAVANFFQTYSYVTCMKDSFEEVHKHYMHVLTSPDFQAEDLEKVRANFIERHRQLKGHPQSLAAYKMKELLYSGHPYGYSLDDAIEYMSSITLDDIKELHRKYVQPTYMVCSVIGNAPATELYEMVAQNMDGWNGSEYSPIEYPSLDLKELPTYDVSIPLLRDQMVVMYARLSDVRLHEKRNWALDLLSYITFYSLGSRIFELREKSGLFYSAGGKWANDVHREYGYDVMSTMINPENKDVAHTAIMNMLEELSRGGVSAKELSAARQISLKGFIDYSASLTSLAISFANNEILGLEPTFYDDKMEYLMNATVDEVNEVARNYINSDGFLRITVGRNG